MMMTQGGQTHNVMLPASAGAERSAEPSDRLLPARINDDVYIAPQLSENSLADATALGIRSIVDITQATTTLRDQAEKENIGYIHFPLADGEWDSDQIDSLLAKIDSSPKPCLVFCEMGLRAAAVAVAFKESRKAVLDTLTGARSGYGSLISQEEEAMLDQLEKMRPEQAAEYKKLVMAYVQSKIRNAMRRPRHQKVTDDFYVGGQVTEDELHKAKAAGIKSVLNLRCCCEAGQFGLGMLAREEETVRSLGLEYAQIPVPLQGPYSDELRSKVEEQLASMIKTHAPVLVHCSTGRRIVEVLEGTKFDVRGSHHPFVVKRQRTAAAPGPGPAVQPEVEVCH